jgi:hypothetical protein
VTLSLGAIPRQCFYAVGIPLLACCVKRKTLQVMQQDMDDLVKAVVCSGRL